MAEDACAGDMDEGSGAENTVTPSERILGEALHGLLLLAASQQPPFAKEGGAPFPGAAQEVFPRPSGLQTCGSASTAEGHLARSGSGDISSDANERSIAEEAGPPCGEEEPLLQGTALGGADAAEFVPQGGNCWQQAVWQAQAAAAAYSAAVIPSQGAGDVQAQSTASPEDTFEGLLTQQMQSEEAFEPFNAGYYVEGDSFYDSSGFYNPDLIEPITTLVISCIPHDLTPVTFRQLIDGWGLAGTYDLYFMPTDGQTAIFNFTHPSFASLCCWLFQESPHAGVVSVSSLQGLDANVSLCGRMAAQDGKAESVPQIIQAPVPCEWALRAIERLELEPPKQQEDRPTPAGPPALRGQFRKTKLCGYNRRKLCRLGASCPYAHSRRELQPVPDLAKTRLCFAFLRNKCIDTDCKYAHGHKELRATDLFYKTELCRWWYSGSCRAGPSCRYAHGPEELRAPTGSQLEDASSTGAFEAPADSWMWQSFENASPDSTDKRGTAGASASSSSAPPPSMGSSGEQIHGGQNMPVEHVAAGNENRMMILRHRKTFMEIVKFPEDAIVSSRRSFSCGDLDQLAEELAQEEEEERTKGEAQEQEEAHEERPNG